MTANCGELTWKRELPTEPGWYWIKEPANRVYNPEPYVIHVRRYGSELAVNNSLIAGWPKMEHSLWAGPIPLPVYDFANNYM